LNTTLAPVLSLNKTRIATAGRDNTARVWELATGQEEIRAPFDSQVVAVLAQRRQLDARGGRLRGRQ
jgi:WD40 repeat protein